MMAMAMEMSEEGKLDGVGHLDWGDSETMIDLIDEIGHRSSDLGDLLAEGPSASPTRRTRTATSSRSRVRRWPRTTPAA